MKRGTLKEKKKLVQSSGFFSFCIQVQCFQSTRKSYEFRILKGKVVIKVTFNNKSDLSTSPINIIGQENSVINYGKR